MIKQVKIINMA